MSEKKRSFDLRPKTRKMPIKKAVSKPALKVSPKVRYFPTLEKKPKVKSKKRIPIIIGIVCIAIITLSVMWVRGTATISIVPKIQKFSLTSDVFTAEKNATSSDVLSYEVVEIKDEQHIIAPATNGPSLQTKAKGTVVLYNNFSTQSLRIPQGTRLSNTAGKVYVTAYAINIPGYKTGVLKNGIKGKAAGSMAVTAVAAQPGPDYNIVPTDLTGDFKIVDYKGTPKYDEVYGRLNPTAAISGGFIGQKQIIASSTLAQAYTLAEQTVQSRLFNRAKTLVPPDYILFDSAYSVDYTTLDPKPASTSSQSSVSADVGVTATFHGILFKKHDLSNIVAKNKKVDLSSIFPEGDFNEKKMESLVFNITNQKTFSFTNGGPLSFALTGDFNLVGSIDIDTLVKRILGRNRAQSKVIFASYSSISEIHATINPFWRLTFPDSSNRITVTQKE